MQAPTVLLCAVGTRLPSSVVGGLLAFLCVALWSSAADDPFSPQILTMWWTGVPCTRAGYGSVWNVPGRVVWP